MRHKHLTQMLDGLSYTIANVQDYIVLCDFFRISTKHYHQLPEQDQIKLQHLPEQGHVPS